MAGADIFCALAQAGGSDMTRRAPADAPAPMASAAGGLQDDPTQAAFDVKTFEAILRDALAAHVRHGCSPDSRAALLLAAVGLTA